jgi:hypothetical protein
MRNNFFIMVVARKLEESIITDRQERDSRDDKRRNESLGSGTSQAGNIQTIHRCESAQGNLAPSVYRVSGPHRRRGGSPGRIHTTTYSRA